MLSVHHTSEPINSASGCTFSGIIRDFVRSFTGKHKITIEIEGDFTPLYNGLADKLIDFTAKPHREKRSLNSNAYCWLLCTKIANVLRSSKEEVYVELLRKYGQSVMVSILSAATERFERTIRYYDKAGESKLNGKLWTHYKVYTGSSEYTTYEMGIFLDGVVSDAQELGIQTEPPDKLQKMKEAWHE